MSDTCVIDLFIKSMSNINFVIRAIVSLTLIKSYLICSMQSDHLKINCNNQEYYLPLNCMYIRETAATVIKINAAIPRIFDVFPLVNFPIIFWLFEM